MRNSAGEQLRMKDGKQLPGSHREPVKTFQGHDNSIISIATFSDGKRIATGSADNTIRIWRLEDGKEMMKWVVKQWVGTCIVLGNGKQVVSAEGEDPTSDPKTGLLEEDDFDKVVYWGLWVRDVESGSIVAGPLKGHTNIVETLDISPDGEILASGSFDRTVILWDTTTWQRKGHPLACGSPIHCIRFSPTGQLGVATKEDIQIWDLEGRKRLAQFKGHRGFNINAWNHWLTWTRDDAHLFSAGDYKDPVIRCWDTSTSKQVGDPWTGHDDDEHIQHIVLNPAGTLLASASDDRTVRLWQFPTGTEVARFEHSDMVYRVAFSVDGRSIFSGGGDEKISQWEIPEDVLAAAESVSLASAKNEAGRAKNKMKGLHNSDIHGQRQNRPVNYQHATYSASPLIQAGGPSSSRSLDVRTFFNGMRPKFDKKGKKKEHQPKRKAPRVVDVPLGIATPGDAVGVDDGVRPYVLFFCLSWFQKKEKKPVPRPVYDDDPSDDESEHSVTNVPIPTTRTQSDAPQKVKLNPATFFQSQPEAGPSRLAPPVDNEQEVDIVNVSMPTPRVQISQREDIELKLMVSQSQPEAGPSRLEAHEEYSRRSQLYLSSFTL